MFIRDYDGLNNLLVVYYTGHAVNSSETKKTEFHAYVYIYIYAYLSSYIT